MTRRERDWTVTDEEYQRLNRMPVETTRAVFTAIFGPGWKKGALSIFGRFHVNAADIEQWEKFGCPPWALDDMVVFLRALKESAEGARREELEAALKTVPYRPTVQGVTQH